MGSHVCSCPVLGRGAHRHDSHRFVSATLSGVAICFIAYACFMLPKYSVNAEYRADVMVSVKFVYGNYRADVWFYSFLMLMRNLVTAFVPALAPNDPGIQLAIMTQALILSFALHCYLWPWHMPLCNAMDFLSLSCCLSVVVLAAGYLAEAKNGAFFSTCTSILMFVGIIGGLLCAILSFLLMTPPAKANPASDKLGAQLHLLGEAPPVEKTAEMLKASSVILAKKPKEDIMQTIKDLDAYDKRRLMFMARLLDTEFHTQKQTQEDAPMPMKRIKSTASLEASLEAAAEVGEMPAGDVRVVTV